LLDEPFSSIDAALRARVRTDVRQILTHAGATAIFVTHDQEEALSIADRVAVMWAGRLLQLDTPERIYRLPATREVAQFVGGMASLPGEVNGNRAVCELGQLVCASEVAGAAELFIRPESVRFTPSEFGEARIVRREFFGHDRRYVAELRSGRHIGSWTGIDVDLEVGQRVRVEVQDPVVAFPFASSTPRTEASELLSPFG
jgi:iron(III) transport system ATP-binding protein